MENWREHCVPCLYRPFDTRVLYYHPYMVDWGRPEEISGGNAPGTSKPDWRGFWEDNLQRIEDSPGWFIMGIPGGNERPGAVW